MEHAHSFPVDSPAEPPLIPFAIAIGLVSITALALDLCDRELVLLTLLSSLLLLPLHSLYAIAKYTFVATADNLLTAG